MAAICIDIDNVIARTDEVMRQVIHDFTGGKVKLAYEDIIEFDYWKCKDREGNTISKSEWKSIHELFSEPRYLWKIHPEPDVQDHLRTLGKTFDLHFATSRLPKARGATIEWLDNYGFPTHDLHFLKHGDKHVSLGKVLAAVEDHYEQAVDFAKLATPCFLLEHPWNKGKPRVANLQWVKGWPELTQRLLSLPRK